MATYFGSTDNTVNSDAFSYVYTVKIDGAQNIMYDVSLLPSTTCVMSDSLPVDAVANNNFESVAGESVAITGGLAAYLDTLLLTLPPGAIWEANYNGYSAAGSDAYGSRPPIGNNPNQIGPNPYAGIDQPIILISFKTGAGGSQLGQSQYLVLSNSSIPPVDANVLVAGQYDPNTDYPSVDFTAATPIAGTYYYSCFEKNTLVSCPGGEVVVSELKIGDKVLTQDGRAVDIQWIGYQAINSFFAKKHDSMPIKIAAGALGDDLPKNDLYVSPDHAFLMDDLLVNASALVNGTSITQMQAWAGNVEYYHIETEDHEMILAEGVPAETLLDNSGREKFANYKEFQELYPQGKLTKELHFPRVKFPRQLPEHIKKRLAAHQGNVEMAA